jgi:tricarballylate dehydrogenase
MPNAKYDVVVVGAGNAALCAALSAREQGASVLVLERAPEDERGGNTTFTGGGFRMVHRGLEDIRAVVDLSKEEIENTDFGKYSADEYLDDLARVTQFNTDPDLAEILVNQSNETVRWIHKIGVRFVPRYGLYAFKQQGRYQFFGGTVVEANGGGRGLLDGEYKAALRQGVEIRYDSQAVELLGSRSRVDGVKIVTDDAEEIIAAKTVVLASGGFEANREWRTRYLGPGWDMAKVRGSRYNTGDGIRMALDIGAQPHGQWSGCHAISWERYAPDYGDVNSRATMQRQSYPFSVMINADGKRFVDEGADFRNYTYAKYGRMVLQQPGSFAYHVFDAQVSHLVRDEYRLRGVTKVQGNTLEELAQRLEDVNSEQFLKTVREYNAAVKRDVPFSPNVKDGRCTVGLELNKSNWANTLEQPPFEAFAVTCGITFTFGGLKIDTTGHVLDIRDRPIKGLYAAGELVGGLFYFNYPGSSGLMAGSVFGRIAGRSAAMDVQSKVAG